jgi:hypothetical protein
MMEQRSGKPMPYYQRDNIMIYCGNCLEVMPQLEASSVDAVITDPVWPNATPELVGADDPLGLLARSAAEWPRLAKRVIVQLGCNSDPRILSAIPGSLPFLRVCSLEHVLPGYVGRLLYTGDIAYVFGEWPRSGPGRRVIPGRYISTDTHGKEAKHPCPRKLSHVNWLVNWFGENSVLDPFMGSGTTGVACVQTGRKFVGIEIEEKYCQIAVERIEKALMQPALPGVREEPKGEAVR